MPRIWRQDMNVNFQLISEETIEKLYTSYFPAPGSPEHFYRKYGFEPTGEMDDDEVVMVLRF